MRRSPFVYLALGAIVGGLLLVPTTVLAATGHPLHFGGDTGVAGGPLLPGRKAAATTDVEQQMIEACLNDMRPSAGQMMDDGGMTGMMSRMVH